MTTRKNYNYDVEIELENIDKNKLDMKSISTQLKKCIKFVLSGLQGTDYPISYPKQDSVLNEYMHIINKDISIFENENTKRSNQFIGPSSVTLKIQNVLEDENNLEVNIQKDFCVTDKADGERKLLYINAENKLYFINTNLEIQYTGVKLKRGQNTKIHSLMVSTFCMIKGISILIYMRYLTFISSKEKMYENFLL